MTATQAKRPFDTVQLGSIKGAIWRNVDQHGNGRFNTTFERVYRDDKGDWHSTNSFGRDDLLVLAKVADIANTRVFELMARERRHGDRSDPEDSTEPTGSPKPTPASGGTAAKARETANAR